MNKAILALTAVIALAACQRSEPEVIEATNNSIDLAIEAPPVDATTAAAPVNTATAPAAAPPPAFEDSEQMRDDADATGLTARLPEQDTAPGQSGNESRPAE